MLARPKATSNNPGVYLFRCSSTPLYIGKAANLKQRLASYFQKRAQLPAKIQMMLKEATGLKLVRTKSEIEALLLESELIKKYRPKYNALMRDDKSYFYVGLTREPFPRIFVTHEPAKNLKALAVKARYIGPFTGGTALYITLKLLRRVFPYCTCKRPHKRPCLNSEIGRCPGYCCASAASSYQRPATSKQRSEYRKNIRNIVAVLEGRRTRLVGTLKKQMKQAVKREQFEEAARMRDQIFGLEDVFMHRPVLREPEVRYAWPAVLSKLQTLLKTRVDIKRIEGYDIANIGAEAATGSMVVFVSGQPDKSQYRKFRIKTVAGISDVDMLKEVLGRRLGHPEWPYPELMVIDGGRPQLGAALKTLEESRIWNLESRRLLVTALAKREEILYTANGRQIPLRRQDPAILHFFQRIRDESHRFARVYHHKLRQIRFAYHGGAHPQAGRISP